MHRSLPRCSLASHSAAGLVTSVRKLTAADSRLGEAARMLRCSESLARSATAILTSMADNSRATSNTPVRGSVVKTTASDSVAAETARVSAGAPSAQAPRRRRRKRCSKQNKANVVKDNGAMDVDDTGPATPRGTTSCATPTPARPFSEEDAATKTFAVGTPVVLDGLTSRVNLNGAIGTVSHGMRGERIAVTLPDGESILVKAVNVRPSIFYPRLRSPRGRAGLGNPGASTTSSSKACAAPGPVGCVHSEPKGSAVTRAANAACADAAAARRDGHEQAD